MNYEKLWKEFKKTIEHHIKENPENCGIDANELLYVINDMEQQEAENDNKTAE